jgi:electron transfer flavoprotein beta subunit
VKILVTVKRVPDPESVLKVNGEGTGFAKDNIKWVVNPFDEIAVEEGLRIKEKAAGSEVVLVSIGDKAAQEQLRTGLAMGADRAVLVVSDADLDPLAVAKVLKKVVETEKPELVLMGKQAIDDDANCAGQMLAELLGWPQATFASEVKFGADGKSAQVTREIDGGLETLEVPLPAVVTADLRLNEPRYASLPNIMKAKKKPIDETTPEALGVDIAPRLKVISIAEPKTREAGVKVDSVAVLVDKLKNEAGVL